jgi:hypothetical protein
LTARSAFEPSALVVVAPDVLSSTIGSEQVMLNLRDGIYYGLEAIGSEIWTLLQQPITVAEICQVVVDRYDVEGERCRQDVVGLLGELVKRGLIEVRP